MRICRGKSCISLGAPLHWGTNAIAVTQVKIITHSDFIAIVNNRSSRKGEEQVIQQLDLFSVVAHEWSKTVTYSQVDLCLWIFHIHLVHVISFFISNHFKC